MLLRKETAGLQKWQNRRHDVITVRVKPLQNYLILVSFNNGENRVYNCYPLLEDKLFSELRDVSFFNTVHVDEMGLVCWNDYTDIEPNELYENSESIEAFVA